MRHLRAIAVGLGLTSIFVGCSVPDKQPIGVGGDGGIDVPVDGAADSDAPTTTITAAPAEFSSASAAIFEFTSDDASATYECSVDGETPAPCTTPFTRSLTDGTHGFSVRAIDVAGNGDDSPAEHLWTIDTVAPTTMLTDTPPAADNSDSVKFGFASNERNAVFDCSLDGGSYLPCENGSTVGPLSDGAHAFAVRARDRAGNVDASPAVHAWAVDTSTPDTQLLSGPTGATTSTSASFSFVSPDAGPDATFQCSVDEAAFVACTSPRNLSGLAAGAHTFAVRVRDAVGNFDPTPAHRTWVVDLTPPDTMILSGPSGMEPVASAGFTFTSNELVVSYACSLDGAPFAGCTSPFNALALAQGPHTFSVRATDAAGHVDPTPATGSWTVDTIAPDVTITDGPAAGGTTGPRVTFGFTSTEGTVTCGLDTAPFAACTSPLAFSLAAGPHQLRVRATDGAGNITTASRDWTVACAAPDVTGAVALLHLDETGQVLDNAVGGTDATLGSSETPEPGDPAQVANGRFGPGLAFTAAQSDHVAWPVALAAMPHLTVELWAHPDAITGTRDLLVSGDGRLAVRVVAVGPAMVRFSVTISEAGTGAPWIVTSSAVATGAWHHVVASLEQPNLRLWVDGVRTETTVRADAAAPALDSIRIGGEVTTAYDGKLDEVWISQAALTTDDAVLARYCPL